MNMMMMILMMESSPITPANVRSNTDDVEHEAASLHPWCLFVVLYSNTSML